MSHVRCRLKKGGVETTAWIPEKFAQNGRGVVLKRNGVWDEGWVIVEISSPEIKAEVEEK